MEIQRSSFTSSFWSLAVCKNGAWGILSYNPR